MMENGKIKPRILLSASTKTDYYIDAVLAAGGEPVLAYCPSASDEGFDGLILCGGNDIDPSYYGEEINGSAEIDPARDEAEFAVLEAFLRAKKPVFGVCRGFQLLNVAFGGSLYQHLPNVSVHRGGKDEDILHSARAERGSVFYELYGEELTVNSLHHQAVKELGKGLRVGMTAGDVVEGFRHARLPVLGVQWHPERLCCRRARPDAVDGGKIFSHFIDLCTKSCF